MKTCILCGTQIKPKYRLCASCHRSFKEYMHEPWFLELATMQKRQDTIDSLESIYVHHNIGADIYGTLKAPIVSSRRNVGRPSTDWRLVNEILQYFDQSVEDEEKGIGKRLSLRGMQKKMNGKVKYLTVRRILLTYRRDVFLRKKEGSNV